MVDPQWRVARKADWKLGHEILDLWSRECKSIYHVGALVRLLREVVDHFEGSLEWESWYNEAKALVKEKK